MTAFDLYCRLYVDFPSLDELRGEIAMSIDGQTERNDVWNDIIYLNVRRSDDYDRGRADAEDFLYFPFSAEVDATHEVINGSSVVSSNSFLEELARLIRHLREQGAKVVASCDFEDALAECIAETSG